ncbi:MAG TPA: MOSC domain-containing protein [Gemmatimonadales bacterium]|nr:MOSC domain-containing protein [Gemmatimonadales bacterium]
MAHLLRLSVKPKTPGEYGLPKQAVDQLDISPDGAAGDYNNYRTRTLKGDPDQAIMMLTDDVIQQLRAEGWPVQPGDFGENLTLGGVREGELGVGCRVQVGAVILEISKPCDPCTELGVLPYVGKARSAEFIKTTRGRRGWYARVLAPGSVRLDTPVLVRPASPPAPVPSVP